MFISLYQVWFQNLESNVTFPPQWTLIPEENPENPSQDPITDDSSEDSIAEDSPEGSIAEDSSEDSIADDEILALYDVVVYLASDETISNPPLLTTFSKMFNVPIIETVYNIHSIYHEQHHHIYQSTVHTFLHTAPIFANCSTNHENIINNAYLQSKTAWIANRIEDVEISMGNRLTALITSLTLFLSGTAAVLNTLNKFGFLFEITKDHNEIRRCRLAQAEFSFYLLQHLRSPPSVEDAADIISSAFWIEHNFLTGTYFHAEI
jgi:hypothetical protein